MSEVNLKEVEWIKVTDRLEVAAVGQGMIVLNEAFRDVKGIVILNSKIISNFSAISMEDAKGNWVTKHLRFLGTKAQAAKTIYDGDHKFLLGTLPPKEDEPTE